MATSAPISTHCFTGLQISITVSKSMPCPCFPANDSPLSFSRTLLYFGTIFIAPFPEAGHTRKNSLCGLRGILFYTCLYFT